MTLVVPNQGELVILGRLLNNTTGNLRIKLFTNSFTIVEGTVVGDFTEATAAGYPAGGLILTQGSWTVANDAGTSSGTYTQQTFTFTGSETVEGYYITDLAGTNVLWAEEFVAPANIPAGGGTLRITPAIEAA